MAYDGEREWRGDDVKRIRTTTPAEGLPAVALGALLQNLHEAATEAQSSGYPRMAQLLDECGYALATPTARNRRSVEERAHASLAAWSTLRAS